MNYSLTNFKIKTVTSGAGIADTVNGVQTRRKSEFLSCTAFNPLNAQEASHKLAIFDEGVVARYKAVMRQSDGGMLPDEGWTEEKMPKLMRVFLNGSSEEYDLGGAYVRKYTSDIIAADSTIKHKAGETICNRAGEPVIITKIQVFCQYQFLTEPILDDFGMPQFSADGVPLSRPVRDAEGNLVRTWVSKMSPAEVGESLKALLVPYEGMEKGSVSVDTDGTVSAEIPAQQPTPPVQPTMPQGNVSA